MKAIKQVFGILVVAIFIISCKGDDPKPLTEEQQTLKELAKTWGLSTASVDGKDVTEWFSGLKVSFTESKSFIVQNAVPPIWIASGSFELQKSGQTYIIKRSDGMDLTISGLSDEVVTITMSYTAPLGARTESISGSYSYLFVAE